MLSDITGVQPPSEALTVWTAAGESVVVCADHKPDRTDGVRVETVKALQAYRLTPAHRGRYEIAFGPDQLTLQVTVPLPPADCGFGYYSGPGNLRYPQYEQACYKLIADAGCNTMAAHAQPLVGEVGTNQPQQLARQLNAAARAGLLRADIPVVCTGIRSRDLPAAQALAELPWPELIAQGPEESNPAHALKCKRYRQVANGRGYRLSSTTVDYYLEDLGPHLDIAIWQAPTCSDETIARAAQMGLERWAFHAEVANPQNAALHRWAFGLWQYRARPRVALVWAMLSHQPPQDYSHIVETPNGPMPTPALEGHREGIIDYRALQALASTGDPTALAWIARVMGATPCNFWPRRYFPPWHRDTDPDWTEADEQWRSRQVPTLDMAQIRADALWWWEYETQLQLREE